MRAVEVGERFFRRIEVADVVFCRVFRAFAVQIGEQRVFDRRRVAAGLQDVVLVHDVAEVVTVVEFGGDVLVDFGGQALKPVVFVAAQRDVEREQVADCVAFDRVVAVGGTGGGKAVQRRLRAFFAGAGVVSAVVRVGGEVLFEVGVGFVHAAVRHFQDEVVFVFLPHVLHEGRQVASAACR